MDAFSTKQPFITMEQIELESVFLFDVVRCAICKIDGADAAISFGRLLQFHCSAAVKSSIAIGSPQSHSRYELHDFIAL